MINVSSVSGLHGSVGQINYAAAKSGVIGMTKTICKEWGSFGVRANTVAFGYVQTRYVLPPYRPPPYGVPGRPSAETGCMTG